MTAPTERTEPDEPADPAPAPSEREALTDFLEYFRTVLVRKTWGLTDEQLRTTLPPSSLTLGALLHHLAFVEDYWFDHVFAGHPPPAPWDEAPWDDDADWEMTVAATLSHEQLLDQFEASCARSRAVVAAAPSLDDLAATTTRRGRVNLRWILVHMVEEYARHAGHADFIRESLDGRTGD